MSTSSDVVHIWLPRGDEHQLSASLGLCEHDPALLRELVISVENAIAGGYPGCKMRVHRWHVWKLVRDMHRLGQCNTPAGRAATYKMMAEGGRAFGRDDAREE